MYIREATAKDNLELQALQARCPQGKTLIVSTVNTPNFFARAKAYEDCKVYVACEDTRIIGSAACAVRDAIINGKIVKAGHEFQLFVDPEYRGKRIAGQLHQVSENYLRERGAILSYALIIEGNTPSIHHITRQDFKLHRTLVMPCIAVFKEMQVVSRGKVRSITQEDLTSVAVLLNETWQGYELYESATAESLTRLFERMPAFSYDNVFVLEDNGQIMACSGFWDWSKVTRITVKAISLRMRATGFLLDAISIFRPIPHGPRPGDELKQMVLTPIGFKDPRHIAALLRYVNNQAFLKGIQQIFFISERRHPLMSSLSGFIHIDGTMNLYIKPLRDGLSLAERPVFINGLDV